MRATPAWTNSVLELLLRQIETLQADLIESERRAAKALKRVDPTQIPSARNLIHYIALRRHELRGLQDGLSSVGLSSLGRSEAHVLATVTSVRDILQKLLRKVKPSGREVAHLNFQEGRSLLKEHTEQVLGRKPAPRFVRIMATLPPEAATQPGILDQLLEAGTDCVRINCAHDTLEAWTRMVENLRQAEAATGRNCRVLFDLGGPKIRTGPIEAVESVIKLKPKRDLLGRVTAPARARLTPAEQPMPAPDPAIAEIPMPANWLKRIRVGDELVFQDTREKERTLAVVGKEDGSFWVECSRTAFLHTGTRIRLAGRSKTKSDKERLVEPASVGQLPESEQCIVLKPGDQLLITRSLKPGRPPTVDSRGGALRPGRIGCTAPEIFSDVKPDEQIWFDDGKIGGVIECVEKQRLTVRITQARAKGEKLWADKGINFPDSRLRLPALTPKDIQDLEGIAPHADLVGYSFVQTPADVRKLQGELHRLRATRVGIVLKIETRQAFEQLPNLLLAAMQSPHTGVMIARGDLAVECGYERLAELQEEILWVCEAAHVPVIWATQVLESLARDGMPSRAEVTDAAMGVRAECVMLNKGPEQVAAVRTLDRILRLMESHQNKKTSMLRSLSLAREFIPS